MRSMSITQREYFFDLIKSLDKLEPHERHLALKSMGDENDISLNNVLSLVKLHFGFPPEPGRCLTGERIRNFYLEKPIGSGGMGVVYKAKQKFSGSIDTERVVAVKLINSAFILNQPDWARENFNNEIRYLAKLEHPGIARLYDAGIYQEQGNGEAIPYFAMEYIQGRSIYRYVRQDRGRSRQTAVLELFLLVLDAVVYAHQLGIIHRDLKPDNILVNANGVPRIIDFGLAQIYERSAAKQILDIFSGTPAYMSPEQVSDDYGLISPACDVYALGIILFELLAGQRPYQVPSYESPAITARSIINAKPERLSKLCPRCGVNMDRIIGKALSKDPDNRYASAKELHEDISRIITDIKTGFSILRKLREGAIHLLSLGVIVGVVGYAFESPYALTSAWLIVELVAIFSVISVFLELSNRYIKVIQPMWNSTLIISVTVGMVSSLIGGCLYAFGPVALTDNPDLIEPVWHIRLLRFLVTGLITSFLYGVVFSLSAAKREDKLFRVTEWYVLAWLVLVAVMGTIIYVAINITEIRIISKFLSGMKQGDVRFEVFLLTAGLITYLMIVFHNWQYLTRSINGAEFISRITLSLTVLILSGSIFASIFWGMGLAPEGHTSFAVPLVVMLFVWSMTCYHLFTGQHRLIRWTDTWYVAMQATQWLWTKRMERARDNLKEEWFSR